MDRIERSICKKLEPLLVAGGFALKKEMGGFARPQPYGHDRVMVVNQGTAAPGPQHFAVSVHFSIRHDRIEIPWNTLGLVWGEENQRMTTTLVYGFPRDRKLPSLKVMPATMEKDIELVAVEAEALFKEEGLPFFEQFATLEALEAFANHQPLAELYPYSLGGPMEHRAMRSMLLAKTVNPGRYAAVRETFIRLDQGMFPREQRMAMLQKVDAMEPML
jgi:hypothetical protein